MNEPLQSTLCLIAEQFNAMRLTWGLGGSALLDVMGLAVQVHDLDIMVLAKDFDRASEILNQLGIEKKKAADPNFRTTHFMCYRVNDCDVDVMAGICVFNDSEWFDFVFKANHIKQKISIENVEIPLMSLSDWRQLYQAMGRVEKRNLIDQFMQEKGNHEPFGK